MARLNSLGVYLGAVALVSVTVIVAQWSSAQAVDPALQNKPSPSPPSAELELAPFDPEESEVENLSSLVRSRSVLTEALRDPEVCQLRLVRTQSDPAAWLEKVIKVSRTGPRRFSISIPSERPDEAARLVDAIASALVEEVQARREEQDLENLERLKAARRQLEDSLTLKYRELEEIRQRVDQDPAGLPLDIDLVRREYTAVVIEMTKAKAALDAGSDTDAGDGDQSALKARIVLLERQAAGLRQLLRNEPKQPDFSFEVRQLQTEVEILQRIRGQLAESITRAEIKHAPDSHPAFRLRHRAGDAFSTR